MLIAPLLTTVPNYKKPHCPSVSEWVSKTWHIDIRKAYSLIKKEQIPNTSKNIDESQHHCTGPKKVDTNENIQCDFINIKSEKTQANPT